MVSLQACLSLAEFLFWSFVDFTRSDLTSKKAYDSSNSTSISKSKPTFLLASTSKIFRIPRKHFPPLTMPKYDVLIHSPAIRASPKLDRVVSKAEHVIFNASLSIDHAFNWRSRTPFLRALKPVPWVAPYYYRGQKHEWRPARVRLAFINTNILLSCLRALTAGHDLEQCLGLRIW